MACYKRANIYFKAIVSPGENSREDQLMRYQWGTEDLGFSWMTSLKLIVWKIVFANCNVFSFIIANLRLKIFYDFEVLYSFTLFDNFFIFAFWFATFVNFSCLIVLQQCNHYYLDGKVLKCCLTLGNIWKNHLRLHNVMWSWFAWELDMAAINQHLVWTLKKLFKG